MKKKVIYLVLLFLILVYSYSNDKSYSKDEIPSYSGNDYVVLNNNIPYFSKEDKEKSSFEEYYDLDYEHIKYTELEAKQKGVTYSVPLKAKIDLTFLNDGHIIQKDIYMGDIPLMTERGTGIWWTEPGSGERTSSKS